MLKSNIGDLFLGLLNSKTTLNLAQFFSILSLNIYFKNKISKVQKISLADKIFNYCVVGFLGNILVGKEAL
jgi:hypothetical protein